MTIESPRIALAVDGYIGTDHGTEMSTRNIVCGFTSTEATYTLVTPYALREDIPATGIILPHGTVIEHSPYHHPDQAELDRAVDAITHENPDIIVLTTPNYYIYDFWYALPDSFKSRCVLLWRMHADVTSAGNLGRSNGETQFSDFYEQDLLQKRREMLAATPLNLAISQSVARSLVRLGASPDTIQIVPTQIGNDFRPDFRFGEPNFREKFLRPRQFGILGIGRLVPEKMWDWVVDIYGLLKSDPRWITGQNRFDEVKITVGGGPLADNLYFQRLLNQQKAWENSLTGNSPGNQVSIEWLGTTVRPNTDMLMNAYDVGALFMGPDEAYGRVTVDALSCGLPVMGNSACDSTVEIMSGSQAQVGKVFTEPSETIDFIIQLMADHDTHTRLQHNAAAYGATFTLEKAEQAWWNALESMKH